MKTKKYLKFILGAGLCFGAGFANGQDFQTLVCDKSEDPLNQAMDAHCLSYKIDAIQDSIWFRISTYEAYSSKSWGVKIGVDNNLFSGDGQIWQWPSNQNLTYDVLITALHHAEFGFLKNQIENDQGDSIAPINVEEIDPFTLQIGMRLSTIDNDANMNVVAATTTVQGSISDAVPDTGYVRIQEVITSLPLPVQVNTEQLSVYPNPSSDGVFSFSRTGDWVMNARLFDLTGKVVFTFQRAQQQGAFSIAHLPDGVYYLKTTTGETRKLVIAK